jgi:segregation and condensation protein A
MNLPSPNIKTFEVSLGIFDGPVDLLLHLVKRRELPLDKISLLEVAQQYFDCVEILTRQEFESAGEYLVIAATLLSLKARHLLGEDSHGARDQKDNDQSLDGDEDILDPNEELLKQLREAAIFRKTATELGSRALLWVDVFPSVGFTLSESEKNAPLKSHDPMTLGLAFKRLLERVKGSRASFSITVDSLSIADRMMMILNKVDSVGGEITFPELFSDGESISVLISSFLALLELCKRSALIVLQEDPFSEIRLARSTTAISGDQSIRQLM